MKHYLGFYFSYDSVKIGHFHPKTGKFQQVQVFYSNLRSNVPLMVPPCEETPPHLSHCLSPQTASCATVMPTQPMGLQRAVVMFPKQEMTRASEAMPRGLLLRHPAGHAPGQP